MSVDKFKSIVYWLEDIEAYSASYNPVPFKMEEIRNMILLSQLLVRRIELASTVAYKTRQILTTKDIDEEVDISGIILDLIRTVDYVASPNSTFSDVLWIISSNRC